MSKVITYAPDAWKILNGIFCVYKPAGVHPLQMRATICGNLVRDLNELEVRPPRQHIKIEGSLKDGQLTVTQIPSFADRELVLGPRYQPQDVSMTLVTYLGKDTSGVCILGVNDSRGAIGRIRRGNLLRVYEIDAKFGIATENFMEHGKVLEKSTYHNIKRFTLDKVLSAIQAAHQVLSFQCAGVPLQSQEAYDMASKGIVRPAANSAPIIYGLRCTLLELPNFTIEMQVINETEDYLKMLVNDIGLKMRSSAACVRIRQTRYGHFDLNHALLRKHWTLEHIINNIRFCQDASSWHATVPQIAHLQHEVVQKYIGKVDSIENDDDDQVALIEDNSDVAPTVYLPEDSYK